MRREEERKDAGAFTVLFTSLSILILAFFIYLTSVSTIDESRHRAAYGSVLGAFGLLEGGPLLEEPEEGLEPSVEEKPPLSMKKPKTREGRLKEIARSKGLSELVEVEKRGEDLIIRFQERSLFKSGSADLSSDAYDLLMFVGDWIKVRSLQASVEGHTDSIPISTAAFPSNWELSAKRALSVLRFLIDRAGVPEELLSVRGFGPSRPVADNSTPEGRAKNRRVEIVL
ncbi:MAG TPA: hypothetical protein ENF73_03300, partial [Proteobacteria bacterium]|nr:hypothetical protein [Pseudomonadota bacterium]